MNTNINHNSYDPLPSVTGLSDLIEDQALKAIYSDNIGIKILGYFSGLVILPITGIFKLASVPCNIMIAVAQAIHMDYKGASGKAIQDFLSKKVINCTRDSLIDGIGKITCAVLLCPHHAGIFNTIWRNVADLKYNFESLQSSLKYKLEFLKATRERYTQRNNYWLSQEKTYIDRFLSLEKDLIIDFKNFSDEYILVPSEFGAKKLVFKYLSRIAKLNREINNTEKQLENTRQKLEYIQDSIKNNSYKQMEDNIPLLEEDASLFHSAKTVMHERMTNRILPRVITLNNGITIDTLSGALTFNRVIVDDAYRNWLLNGAALDTKYLVEYHLRLVE